MPVYPGALNIQVVGELAACLRGGEPKPWPVGGVR
jgi:hypothetical protein